MTTEKMLSEIDQLEALADTVKDKCSRLRSELERGVGARSGSRKGKKYAGSISKALAKRNETINKRATAGRR